jgi:glycosyltransferase involved in cell wall biosynthesis
MVRPSLTGFLAQKPAQWIEAINHLAHDPLLRRRLGAEGRRQVEERFSVTHGAERWMQILAAKSFRKKTA